MNNLERQIARKKLNAPEIKIIIVINKISLGVSFINSPTETAMPVLALFIACRVMKESPVTKTFIEPRR